MPWGEPIRPSAEALMREAADRIENDAEAICGEWRTGEWPNCTERLCVDAVVLVARLRKAAALRR